MRVGIGNKRINWYNIRMWRSEGDRREQKNIGICKGCEEEFTYYGKEGKKQYCNRECYPSNREYKRRKYKIFCRDKFKCAYCGRSSFIDGVVLHLDHIIPEYDNGQTIASNLITVCEICNMSKGKERIDKETEEKILKEVKKRNKEWGIEEETIIKM